MTGTVYLVGAGPGEAGLITVRGAELLKKADVVIYDRLVSAEILALIPAGAVQVDVGKQAGRHPIPQEQINEILRQKARAHHLVLRLKGGDPFLFGRGGEEAEFLAANNIPFEVVPGVTSAIAAPAYAGIPVTHRDYASSLHIITGHGRQGQELGLDYPALARLGGTLVFLMSIATAPAIVKGLTEAGMDAQTPAAVVENGATALQRRFITTLGLLPEIITREGVRSPAVIVVGRVCERAARLAWFEKRPLFGCRVLVTRPRELSEEFGTKLSQLGAGVSYYPCIKTNPLNFEIELKGLTWLAFTSAAGVEAFFACLRDTGRDSRALSGLQIAAVGEKTALALEQYGIYADFTPTIYDGEHLARQLLDNGHIQAGQHLALYRAEQGGENILDILREAGVGVTDVPVYQTLLAARLPAAESNYDYVTFTSASCVQNFTRANPQLELSTLTALCIGPQTAAAARAMGMKTIVAKQATTAAMAEKLQEVWHEHTAQTAEIE